MDNMCISAETYHLQIETEKSVTLKARDYKDPPLVARGNGSMFKGINGEIARTIDGHYYLGCGNRGGVEREVVYNDEESEETMSTVRRLTPVECERLQGFPDGWTDIGEWTDSKGRKRETVDSARYKALGNSIALPYWFRLLRRISAVYDRPATLGSLFDGISGFPLAWSRCNGSKTCLWSSEIEEFPIAVCKAHFGDDDTGEVGDIEKYI